MSICETETALAKRGDLNDFRLKGTASFSSIIAQTRHLKRHNKPEYRRINRYFKSPKQYWKERNRRKQIIKLTNEGLTLQQIAKKIGVSYRTVRRDAERVQTYLKAQFNKHMAQLQREYREKLNRELEGLSMLTMGKRFQMLTNLMYKTRKLSKQETFKQHNNIIFVNMDKLDPYGFPTFDLAFRQSRFKTPYNLQLVVVKGNEKYPMGGLQIG